KTGTVQIFSSFTSFENILSELMEHHVICYDVEKDLFPLVLSNCQYSLERGHETISEYDLPRIQQQILTHFLQGKPLITRAGIPVLVNTQERDYDTIFKTVCGKVPQIPLSSLAQNTVSRELDSYSEVCAALKIVELLLGFLSLTSGDPTMKLVTYLQDVLKMDQNIDHHILKAFGKCTLGHCVCLWKVLSSLRSENMLRLKRVSLAFAGKSFSNRNVDQWLIEIHEVLLLGLGCLRATEDWNPSWSLKQAVSVYMRHKDVPPYMKEDFPENLQLSQIVETWKYAITAKQEWMMEG
uniref:Ring finger protein 213 n=1 Tax=Neolamprologus brichardi TaxID=32507 RepID=A0A3Q4NC06_NEOBR